MIFDIENSLWKSNFGTFWCGLALRICKKKCFVLWSSVPHGTSNFEKQSLIYFPLNYTIMMIYLERNEAKVGHPFQWNLFNLESSYNKCNVRSIFEILLKSGELVLIFGTSLRSLSFSSVRRSGEISSIPKTNDNCLPDS